MRDVLDRALQSIAEPILGFVRPTSRVYLPYLAVAALIAALVWLVRLRGRQPLVSFLFPRGIWLHPSARLDYQLIFGRALLGATLLAPFVVSSLAVARATTLWLHGALGPGPAAGASRDLVAAVFTLASFLVVDLTRYLLHWLSHRVPVLWQLHKVHHSAEVLTPFTEYRTHPIESVMNRAGAALAMGLVAGACSWAFAGRVSGWMILGVDGLSFVWNAVGANLRHSQVWISYGPVVERILCSPAQHQVHHSDDPRHYDRNFGVALSLWDWLFGTLYLTGRRERLRFGLAPGERNHEGTLLSAWLSPLAAIGRQAARRLAEARALAARPRT